MPPTPCTDLKPKDAAPIELMFWDQFGRSIECQSQQCGGNSPLVNRFPVNGLHSGLSVNQQPCRNAEGTWLVPKSVDVENNACPDGQTLQADSNGALFVSDGTKQCRDRELVGATFAIQHYDEKTKKIYDATIKITGAIGITSNDERLLLGYQFAVLKTDATGSRTMSLCTAEGAAEVYAQLHYEPAATWPDAPAGFSPSDAAVVLPGEVYDWNQHLIANPSENWFNIACVRDGLAKIDVFGIAPIRQVDDEDFLGKRRAALKMLTGNYCNVVRTTENAVIEWDDVIRPQLTNPRLPEAVWTDAGAQCISGARVFGTEHHTVANEAYPQPPAASGDLTPDADCKNREYCRDERRFVDDLLKECNRYGASPPIKRCRFLWPWAYRKAQFISYRRP